ncbi:hypothetical protein PUN28_019984 [Cardiocondyla obscurior]|uniref:Uncharacterized protein n=1 Tax=Cardiocondyla obscurior TaxID=286306 RepID=A0AAW2E950_9HYME
MTKGDELVDSALYASLFYTFYIQKREYIKKIHGTETIKGKKEKRRDPTTKIHSEANQSHGGVEQKRTNERRYNEGRDIIVLKYLSLIDDVSIGM